MNETFKAAYSQNKWLGGQKAYSLQQGISGLWEIKQMLNGVIKCGARLRFQSTHLYIGLQLMGD